MVELAENVPVCSFLPSIKNLQFQNPVFYCLALKKEEEEEKEKNSLVLTSSELYKFFDEYIQY